MQLQVGTFAGDSYLVAGTDGVGTKLKLAFSMDVHNTIGIDLVRVSLQNNPTFYL